MSSVTTVNTYMGYNPLGQKVRVLERELADLRKIVEDMKANGGGSAAAGPGPTGPPGPPGPAGPVGPAGPPGPMAYVALPPQAVVQPAPVTSATAATPAVAESVAA